MTHSEGYKLMKYVSEDGMLTEWLWNSRNGVTPFSIGLPENHPGSGHQMMQHVDWSEDVSVPNFIPPLGMRIFMDHNWKSAREIARRRINLMAEKADAETAKRLRGKDVDEIAKDIVGKPRVVTVTPDIQQLFAQK